MERAEPLDPVDVPDAFRDQAVSLAVRPARILFGKTGRPHHAPHFRLAAQIRHQRAQKPLRVDPVRFHAPRPAIHLEACWIDDVIAYAMRLEESVQPESVIASLIA